MKVFKALKGIKLLLSFGSMAISTLVYSFMMGPPFAIGFIALLFLHEMGHVIALKIRKLPASLPVFIPMLGAMIFVPKFRSRQEEAFVGYGGPFLGSLAALVPFVWVLTTGSHSQILIRLAYTGAFLNLFNLIPIRPLDGGRVTQIIGPWFKYIGIATLLGITIMVRQPVMLLIWILVILDFDIDERLKFAIGATCQVAMMALMFAGYSQQPVWVDVLDTAIATAYNLLMFSAVKYKEFSLALSEDAAMAPAPMAVRFAWVGAYLFLAVGLYVLMQVQVTMLVRPAVASADGVTITTVAGMVFLNRLRS